MAATEFKGFAGIVLRADVLGSPDDPSVLLIHGGGQTRMVWTDVADALVRAGRQVINIDLRGHGESEWPADKRYDFDAFAGDLREVLAQLGSRPVIVATALGGWIATITLGENATPLASGVVLADTPPRMEPEAARRAAERMKEFVATHPDLDWDPTFVGAIDPSALAPRLAAAASKIRAPILYVRGEQSAHPSHEAAEDFVRLMPDAEFVEIPNAFRLVAAERSDEFNALLLDFLERKNPRAAPEYIAGSDSRTLRDAMGCFATGITVVTAMGPEGPVGLTANSFTSVSLDPPLLLVCVARNAGSLSILENATHFGVNILHIGQQPTSNVFASRTPDRFGQVAWERGKSGAPILTNSLASIECARHAVHDGGDHVIFVGKVERARFEPRRDPLLYFSGKYRRLHFG